jgi:uncharacterized membrane protein
MVIHFPVVALLAAVALDGLDAISRTPHWRTTATFLWWVGLLGAGAAIITGLLAFDRVEHSEAAHTVMTLHRNLALSVVGLLATTAVWRWRRPGSPGAALLGVLGAGGLLGVGYLGGELVFRHAIGLPTATVEQIMMERGGHAHDSTGMMRMDHGGAGADSSRMHSAPESHSDSTHQH